MRLPVRVLAGIVDCGVRTYEATCTCSGRRTVTVYRHCRERGRISMSASHLASIMLLAGHLGLTVGVLVSIFQCVTQFSVAYQYVEVACRCLL